MALALQPCVMAVGAAQEHDCPHCPPEPMSHHEMPHAMPAPCGAAAGCDALHDLNYDGRTPQVKLDPPSDHLIAVLPTVSEVSATLVRQAGAEPGWRFTHRAAAPPIHLLCCVFLN